MTKLMCERYLLFTIYMLRRCFGYVKYAKKLVSLQAPNHRDRSIQMSQTTKHRKANGELFDKHMAMRNKSNYSSE